MVAYVSNGILVRCAGREQRHCQSIALSAQQMLEGCHKPVPVHPKGLVEAKASLLGWRGDTTGQAGWFRSFWFMDEVRA